MLRATMLLCACATALLGQRDVPSAEELDRARSEVVRALARRLLHAVGGDGARASSEVLAAAFDSKDRATRYLLWREAVELAEHSGEPWLSLQHERALAADFGSATERAGIALLHRMAERQTGPARLAAVGLTALRAAEQHTTTADEQILLGYYDVAMRAVLRTDYPPLYRYVQDRLPHLRAVRATAEQLAKSLRDSPWPARIVASGLLAGERRMLQPFELRDFTPLFTDFGTLAPDQATGELTPDELVALSGRARHPEVRTGLLRCAQQQLLRGYFGADPDARRAICHQLVTIAERLCTLDGVSRLQFGNRDALNPFVFANGDWRVHDGALIGRATGANNFATHRLRNATCNMVVIRGGIRSADGLNFRCKVGDVNLLLNWEVEPQNHLWQNGTCWRNRPRALTAGELHTIAIFSDGANAHVCIDDEHYWTVQSHLGGTVSVYPALGSEIFVREILIDGNPDGLVDAPVGVMM